MDGKKLIELKQERATLTIGIRSILDEFETRDLPGEKKDELAKMEKRFDELNGSGSFRRTPVGTRASPPAPLRMRSTNTQGEAGKAHGVYELPAQRRFR